MSELAFTAFSLNGVDAQKFLQGQVTVHVERLALNESRYTAICDLKGRIHFGLWIKKLNTESFELVTTHDQAEEFAKHIKKFGAFSKMKLEEIIKDANGNVLADGDSVTVIKDLKIKGSSSVVKVGTKVKTIRLVHGASDGHNIDCKIDGIGAMKLKAEFVKKA